VLSQCCRASYTPMEARRAPACQGGDWVLVQKARGAGMSSHRLIDRFYEIFLIFYFEYF